MSMSGMSVDMNMTFMFVDRQGLVEVGPLVESSGEAVNHQGQYGGHHGDEPSEREVVPG